MSNGLKIELSIIAAIVIGRVCLERDTTYTVVIGGVFLIAVLAKHYVSDKLDKFNDEY